MEANDEIEIKEEFDEEEIFKATNFNFKSNLIANIQVRNVFVSVAQLKPPYCASCDKYYCSVNELQYHINDEHIKGYIEFMSWFNILQTFELNFH